MKQVISVDYSSQVATYDEFSIKLRIPNYFGYVKDVRALFNSRGEKPGEHATVKMHFCKEESNNYESVFIGSWKFSKIGYMTFYIELTINDERKRIIRDPISFNPVFQTEENMPFFEMFIYERTSSVPEGYAGGILYEIFIDTFHPDGELGENWNEEPKWLPDPDGKYRNDKFFGGTIKGIIQMMPHIISLGTTILYITPVFDSPSQNGYDIRDYRKVNPRFGTWDDVKELKTICNQNGIKLVGDCVFNHCSNENPLFQQNPDMFDWIVKYIVPRTWWGYEHLVEFNKSHPGYFEELKDWLLLYSEYFDGIRLDVADQLPDYVLEFINKYFIGYILGEVWKNGVKGDYRSFFFGKELHAVMNYQFPNAIYRYLRYGNHRFFKKTVLFDVYRLYPKMYLDVSPIFMTSHDIPRMPNMLMGQYMKEDPMFENFWAMERDGDWYDGEVFNTLRFRTWEHNHDSDFDKVEAKRMMKLAIFLEYTLPGIPAIFAGDEMYMTGYKDPFNRKPLPWNNIDKETYDYYVRIGKFRSETKDVFSHGNFDNLEINKRLLVYKRNNYYFLVNRSDEEIDVTKYFKFMDIMFETEGKGESISCRLEGIFIKPKRAMAIRDIDGV